MLNRTMKTMAAAAATAVTLAGLSQAQADMLVEYALNETGSSVANSGTLGGSATMLDWGDDYGYGNGVATDLHTADGTGVSGLAGDRAFDTNFAVRSVPGLGGADHGTSGVLHQSIDLDDLPAFTISGWFKTKDSTPWGQSNSSSNETLSEYYRNSGNYIRFDNSQYGDVNEPHVESKAGGSSNGTHFFPGVNGWTETEEWVFFAVTYDGVAVDDTDRMKFYGGTTADAVQLVGTASGTARNLGDDETFNLFFGNDRNMIHAFNGLMDNLRVHNETLAQGDLEGLRTGDVIPEPASLALLGMGAATMLLRRRRLA